MTTEPRIYVACLAAYNCGRLHGEWISCEGLDAEDLTAEVEAMLAKSPVPFAEEHAIHDHEGLEGFDVGEYTALSDVADIVALIEEHGDVARAAASLVVNDLDQVRELCTEKYLGAWDSVEEYAEELLDGQLDLPDGLRCYFAYDRFATDLELSGDISTVEDDGVIHIFDNR